MVKLDVGGVDFGGQTVFVRQGKGRKARLLPIHETALKAIASYLETRGRVKKTEPLFTICGRNGKGRKRLDDTAIGNLFRWIDKRSGKHIHPHLFLHTFAVHLLQGGADVRYVQALLGHESLETTSRYLGLARDELKRTYDEAVESILGEP